MAILPIPTSRVSDYLTRTRLVSQTQSDQLDLFRLQNQISTGRRIFQPSEDGRAALRSITLQRNLERKGQVQVNLGSAQSALISAEGSLNGVSDILNNIRAEAIGVAGTTSTDEERLATRTNVLTALESLVGFANSTYQDNFLFAGSRSLTPPFVFNGSYVEYLGNESNQQQRVDTGILFDTNIPGTQVFGGISEPVRGSTNLNPQVNANTLLTDLNAGSGITTGGSIEIAYIAPSTSIETESTVVDLSGARTLGDVARLIEANGPPSADLQASVFGQGIEIVANAGSSTPGSIVIREVAGGRTADELGILAETPTTTVTGSDLDPLIGLTTRLADLLGTKSHGRLRLAGDNNDLILKATANGDFNDLTVELRTGGTAQNETATFTPGATPTLVVDIEPGQSTAQDIARAINAETSGAFTAEVDYRDATSATAAGTGVVLAVTETLVTSGGGGETLDLAAGLQITNGSDPFTIDTSGAETVEDLLNLLNQPENGLAAAINESRTGIDIRTRRSGADFSIGEGNADGGGDGTLATQLGVRTFTADSRLEDFNRGAGVVIPPLVDDEGNIDPTSLSNNTFTIEVSDHGVTQTYEINLAGAAGVASDDAQTVQDVIDQIFADTGGAVTATLSSVGNGLTLRPTTAPPAIPATPASGTINLGADTLTFTADTPGAAGNQDFTLEIVDSGSGGLSTTVVNGDIVVDLGGTTPSTGGVGSIADDISAQLADFTVTSSGAATISAPAASTPFSTVGGDDGSPAGADQITISGDAAGRLGFFDPDAGEIQATSTTGSIATADRNTIEVDSVFNSLIRLAEALQQGDSGVPDIGEAIQRLDDDLDRATAARGELGSRLQSLESLQFRLEDEEVELRSSLSEELDVDLTQAISDFQARQFSLQASLQTTANLLQLSILNFI